MENMGYYEPDDCFICKNGRHLDLSSHYTLPCEGRYRRKISVYPLRGLLRAPLPYSLFARLKDSEKRKEIFVCWEFQNLRKIRITTLPPRRKGCCLQPFHSGRGAFGQLKHNPDFKRFLTGGKSQSPGRLLFLGFPKTVLTCWQSATVDCKICILIQPKAYLNFLIFLKNWKTGSSENNRYSEGPV